MRWGSALSLAVVLSSGPAAAQEVSTVHSEICDASAGIPVGRDLLLAANDEDNALRVYRTDAPGEALQSIALDSWIDPDPDHPEADIEGAARLGERVFWITSHGRNKNGKARPGRRRLFATTVSERDGTASLALSGHSSSKLLDALLALDSPDFAALHLSEAEALAPEDGGINIEGLAAAPDRTLLIAFRSPTPGGKALAVPLRNPDAVVDAAAAPRFGSPILLDLDGLGIRSLERIGDGSSYWLVAGSPGGGEEFRLYRWTHASSGEELERGRALSFGEDRSPEALFVRPGTGELVVLLDEGDRKLGQTSCKDAPAADRAFSSVRFRPPSP